MIGAVVTRGYGSFGTVALVVLAGYSSAVVVPFQDFLVASVRHLTPRATVLHLTPRATINHLTE